MVVLKRRRRRPPRRRPDPRGDRRSARSTTTAAPTACWRRTRTRRPTCCARPTRTPASTRARVDYIEAHGTGTILGDPIEAEALGRVVGRGRAADKPALLGCGETNVGHLESAAGAAGLAKVVLAMQHDKIPPSINYAGPEPVHRLRRHASEGRRHRTRLAALQRLRGGRGVRLRLRRRERARGGARGAAARRDRARDRAAKQPAAEEVPERGRVVEHEAPRFDEYGEFIAPERPLRFRRRRATNCPA